MENRKYSYELFVAGLTDINCVDKDGVNEAIKWLEDNKIPYSYIELAKASSEFIKCKDNSKYIKINYEGQRAFIKLVEINKLNDDIKYNYEVYEDEIKAIASMPTTNTHKVKVLLERFNIDSNVGEGLSAFINWFYKPYEQEKDELEKLGFNRVAYADAHTNKPFVTTYTNKGNNYSIKIWENSITISDKKENNTFELTLDEFKALSKIANNFWESNK